MLTFLFFLLIAFLVVIALQSKYFIVQYLFFIRYPILLGGLVFLLPLISFTVAPESLRNLYVLEFGGLVIVTWLALFASWVILFCGFVIWTSAPFHTGLPFRCEKNERTRHGQEPAPVPAGAEGGSPDSENEVCQPWIFWVLGFGLASPIVGTCFAHYEGFTLGALGAVIVGSGLALGLRFLGRWGYAWTMKRRLHSTCSTWLERREGNVQLFFGGKMVEHEQLSALPERYKKAHRRGRAFFLVTVTVYLLAGFLLTPSLFPSASRWFPALGTLLLLCTVATWILSYLAYLFDVLRIPVVAFLIVAICMWQIPRSPDNFYDVVFSELDAETEGTGTNDSSAAAFEDALGAWCNVNVGKEPSVITFITVAGGGIKASLWTAVVLEGIENEFRNDLPHGFGGTVALISSVSGGAVGAMYYVDAFDESGAPTTTELQEIVEAAGASSLGASIWGLTYPDLWRLVFGNLIPVDRGWAQETIWSSNLRQPDVSLGDWHVGFEAGWRPLEIFNATLQESGERYLLTSVKIDYRPEQRTISFPQIFGDGDMAVVTAARLSATFPYVTPQARSRTDHEEGQGAFHVADGGYFDNSGVMTALECIERLLTSPRIAKKPTKIALVQIRNSASTESPEPNTGNLLHSFFGPVSALMAVSASSQMARNEFEIKLARTAWAKDVELKPFVFELRSKQLLSWHLAEDEKKTIREHWSTQQDTLRELRTFFGLK